ncbi:thioredoxin domain-containing protein [Segetibacter sp. 3557_3]|uniref:thioredoxin domain-containing protein n=1 Tax=Segetibacter sp. 3557_3 TaxID=2547429 RepID=UPI0010591EB8|nr:thioredoxin domain-containing protein [Segetibacter sp. 3557_3]TDH19793.1 thioredoxin domain-containing protein [Segetibacter sp. 3557_3]
MHTNRLINESSPYLLQHAHNPVDWYPWGEAALSKAVLEDKPLLVSIGYSACHWCHVMERESFEDPAVAGIMNDRFVNIKIDREERPDIDHIYMDAVQAMTGSGGWPLNVFLTPTGKPFFGGTYFPPVRAHQRSTWREVLLAVSEAYQQRKAQVEDQAESLMEHLRSTNLLAIAGDGGVDAAEVAHLDVIAGNLLATADTSWGGFGAAPKFPNTFSLMVLLRHYHYTGQDAALNHVLLSLDKMIAGGIYDQLGGGFARYSTDNEWLAPHFEKMLYDNALLIVLMAEAYLLTNKEIYARKIRETVGFLTRELMDEEGGFYSAVDADSEGVEGKFYTWSKTAIQEILGEHAGLFCEFYGVKDEGNWEGTNILWVTQPMGLFAKEKDLVPEDLSRKLDDCCRKLLSARDTRTRPATDDKILLGWNALVNVALTKAYAATGEEEYKLLAVKNMAFLEKTLREPSENKWFHTTKEGTSRFPAFLDDYATLILAYILLQEITGCQEYLVKARRVCEEVFSRFEDASSGFFFYTPVEQTDVIMRKIEVYDAAVPSGNSTMAINLHYLGIVFDRPGWIEKSRLMTHQLLPMILKYPGSFGLWAVNLQNLVMGMNEIAVVGKDYGEVLTEVLKLKVPNRVLQSTTGESMDLPLLQGKKVGPNVLMYLCKNYQCLQPAATVPELERLLQI